MTFLIGQTLKQWLDWVFSDPEVIPFDAGETDPPYPLEPKYKRTHTNGDQIKKC